MKLNEANPWRPISTYGKRGCGKGTTVKWQHSMAHTGREAPALLQGEAPGPGEEAMMLPIRVEPSRRGDKMETSSRIDYSRMYTVEHYVKVKDSGTVHKDHIKRLRTQWWRIMKSNYADTAGQSTSTSQAASGYLEWVTATAPFTQKNMMTLAVGDRIGVTDYTNEHWWSGLNTRSNKRGLFPPTYVRRD